MEIPLSAELGPHREYKALALLISEIHGPEETDLLGVNEPKARHKACISGYIR